MVTTIGEVTLANSLQQVQHYLGCKGAWMIACSG
ncbi:hypothetical protein I3843_06G042400 [Carya illinoinensis]|nr:hypothetical protein I3843_06G042400 [Carya illinoinensis]